MTREERELSITYLEGIKEKYIEGDGYERHPLPEYYAIKNTIKELQDNSYELWKESYEVEHERNIRLEEKIKALEQEPCKDAISKSDVFETLGNLMSIPYDFDRPINEKDVSESMDEIRALPPVTLARPKGHWINIDKTHSKCDRCGAVFEIASENGEANYCPNCGSLMSKEV